MGLGFRVIGEWFYRSLRMWGSVDFVSCYGDTSFDIPLTLNLKVPKLSRVPGFHGMAGAYDSALWDSTQGFRLDTAPHSATVE